MEDMVDTVLDTGATDMVTTLARDPLMLNPKLMLMPDTCTEVTASDMDMDTDMVDSEDTDMVIMVLDTAAATLVCTEDTDTVTTLERDPLMPNPKLMLDTSMEDMAWEDTTEDMVDTVLDLDTEVMAVSGVRHSEVQLPIAFYKELSSRNCQITIKSKNFLKTSQPLIKYQCLIFVKSRIYGESKFNLLCSLQKIQ